MRYFKGIFSYFRGILFQRNLRVKFCLYKKKIQIADEGLKFRRLADELTDKFTSRPYAYNYDTLSGSARN